MTPSTNTLYKVRYVLVSCFVESTTSKYNSFLLCVPKRSASTIIAVAAGLPSLYRRRCYLLASSRSSKSSLNCI